MYPILDRYGSFFLFSFTVVLGLGLLAGFGVTGWLAGKRPFAKQAHNQWDGWQNGLLLALFVGLLAGRVGFVWQQWEYFAENGDEVWQLWRGGLDYHAALLGGLVAVWLWCLLALRQARRLSFLSFTALISPAFVLVTLFGWAACWLEGCGYGAEGAIGWLTADLPNPLGVFALRYRTQLFAFLLTLPLLGTAVWLENNRPHLAFGITLAGVSLVRLAITPLLGSSAPLFFGGRYELWLEGGFVLLGLLLVQWGWRKTATTNFELETNGRYYESI